MIMQLGIAMLLMWAATHIAIFVELIRYTPNWRRDNSSAEEIALNFIMNAPPERIMFLGRLGKVSSFLGWGGLIMVTAAALLLLI